MITFDFAINNIKELDKSAMTEAKARIDSLAKPVNSLGNFEAMLIKCAGISGLPFNLEKKGVIVMCADNGVSAQNITDSPYTVTAAFSKNFVSGNTCLCKMAEIARADVFPVDIGINANMDTAGLANKKIAFGTKDMTKGPAMTREEAIRSIETGINMVAKLKDMGYGLIATGEMGIGNTTTSSAIASVLLNKAAKDVTGRGAGLSQLGLSHKIDMIEKSIQVNNPCTGDPIDVLAKVGGLDIGGMAGVFIGGAHLGVPIVIDGFISGVAAIIACRLNPRVKDFILPSHKSYEPAGEAVLAELALEPLISARLCLGEGTGAVSTFPFYDMMVNIYNNMILYSELVM